MVVLSWRHLVGLLVVMTGCEANGAIAPTTPDAIEAMTTTITTTIPTTIMPSTTPSVALIGSSRPTFTVADPPQAPLETEHRCITSVPSTVRATEGLNTFMTLVPGTPTLDYSVSATPFDVCPGDIVHVTVTVRSSEQHEVEVGGRLVITRLLPHIDLADFGPVSVPAGGSATATVDFVVPLLPPGNYTFFVADDVNANGATFAVGEAG